MAETHPDESLLGSIDLAIEFAAKAHVDQKRKGQNLPYITHPLAVGILLSRADCPEEVIVAGILHDTTEDTAVTLGEIRKAFGTHVAGIVEGASEPDKTLTWEERKTHTIEFLKTAPLEVKMVVCADKLHNMSTIIRAEAEQGERVWSRFNRGRAQQEWYYRSISESLSAETNHKGYLMLLSEYRKVVERLFTPTDMRPEAPDTTP